VLDFLGLLHAARLVYREGDMYLGLACRPSSRPVRGATRRKPAAEPVYVKDDLTDSIEFEL
jgi:hypothetical protein